jgi:hypothetical protein
MAINAPLDRRLCLGLVGGVQAAFIACGEACYNGRMAMLRICMSEAGNGSSGSPRLTGSCCRSHFFGSLGSHMANWRCYFLGDSVS